MEPIKITSEKVQRQEIKTEVIQKAILSKSEIEHLIREKIEGQGYEVSSFNWNINTKLEHDDWGMNSNFIHFVDSVEVVIKPKS